MSSPNWGWVGACATGSSHIRAGTNCQDNAGCVEVCEAGALVAVVSDGAGSAELSAVGSRIVVNGFIRCATAYLKDVGSLEHLTEEVVLEWIDDIRERIVVTAENRGVRPRDMAATLVAAIVVEKHAAIVHVGDGSIALRASQSSEWIIPSWPAHGEYASTTYFVTDDPQPALQFTLLPGHYNAMAAFTDGLERLALNFATKSSYAPFFDSKFQHLTKLPAGRDRRLSAGLRRYLDSAPILERTDDDKTLILARRIAAQ